MIADDTDAIARRLAELRSERERRPPAWLSSPEQLRALAEMVEAFERWRERVRRIERIGRRRADAARQRTLPL